MADKISTGERIKATGSKGSKFRVASVTAAFAGSVTTLQAANAADSLIVAGEIVKDEPSAAALAEVVERLLKREADILTLLAQDVKVKLKQAK